MRALSLVFFPLLLQAQSRDVVTLEFQDIPSQKESVSTLAMGAPPAQIGEFFWIQTLSRRETKIQELDDFPNIDLRVRDYTYAPLFITDLKTGWKMSLGTFLSFRVADEEFLVHSKTAKLTGFLTFSPPSNEKNRFKWFWGFFVADRSFGPPIFAGAGMEYMTENDKWQFILRFPQLSVSYRIRAEWEIGAFLRYQSASYYLNDHKILKPLGTYVENKNLSIGLMTKFPLPKGFAGNLRVGYNLRNQTSILDSQYDQVRALSESPGVFLSLGLGWGYR